jgi:hypothetical protein
MACVKVLDTVSGTVHNPNMDFTHKELTMAIPPSTRSATRRQRDLEAVENGDFKNLTNTGVGEMLAKYFSYALAEVKSKEPDKGFDEGFDKLVNEARNRLSYEKLMKV